MQLQLRKNIRLGVRAFDFAGSAHIVGGSHDPSKRERGRAQHRSWRDWEYHLRMTEKRRLAIAALAMRRRITTRKRVLVFLPPTADTRSRDTADIVVGGVGILWTGCGVEVIYELRLPPNGEGQLGAWGGRVTALRQGTPAAAMWRCKLPEPLPTRPRSPGKMLRFSPSCFSTTPAADARQPIQPLANETQTGQLASSRYLAPRPFILDPIAESPVRQPAHERRNVWLRGS